MLFYFHKKIILNVYLDHEIIPYIQMSKCRSNLAVEPFINKNVLVISNKKIIYNTKFIIEFQVELLLIGPKIAIFKNFN